MPNFDISIPISVAYQLVPVYVTTLNPRWKFWRARKEVRRFWDIGWAKLVNE